MDRSTEIPGAVLRVGK